MNKLSNIKTFVLDMDGTIYLGNNLFPCTIPFLEKLEKAKKGYYFFTNNSSKNAQNYIDKLSKMGIYIRKEQMLISNHVMINWLLENRKGETAFVVGTKELIAQLEENNITVSSKTGDYVLLGFDTSLNYEKLVIACDLIREGKKIYGLNPDLNCPTETGFIPDCGSISALIKASTGVQCEFFGKPSPHTLEFLLKATNCKEEELAIVGDRLYTDIATAQNSKVTSILVLSGETKLQDIENSSVKPDYVFEDIGQLAEKLY